MELFVELFASIPAVVWSGVVASVLTLSGVLLSNASNTKRLVLQLQHDSTERGRERTGSLRKDVYIKFAAELVSANAHLANLPQVDLDKTNLADGLRGFLAASAQLQLVADPKTTLLASQLSARYNELFFDLLKHLVPVSSARNDIRIADDQYVRANQEVNRVLAEMTRLNESGRPDQLAFEALARNGELQRTNAQAYAEARSEGWKQFNAALQRFQRFLLSQLREIGAQNIAVMVEIRRDLGLTGDLSELELHFREQWTRMEARFDSLIAMLAD